MANTIGHFDAHPVLPDADDLPGRKAMEFQPSPATPTGASTGRLVGAGRGFAAFDQSGWSAPTRLPARPAAPQAVVADQPNVPSSAFAGWGELHASDAQLPPAPAPENGLADEMRLAYFGSLDMREAEHLRLCAVHDARERERDRQRRLLRSAKSR